MELWVGLGLGLGARARAKIQDNSEPTIFSIHRVAKLIKIGHLD